MVTNQTRDTCCSVHRPNSVQHSRHRACFATSVTSVAFSTTHHDALLRLTDLLTSVVSSPAPPRTPDETVAPPSLAPPPAQAPLSRTAPHADDASLRVPIPTLLTKNASLRVPTTLHAPGCLRRTVHFATLPSDILVATFSNSTGLHGKRRRKAALRNRRPHRPLSAAKTIHPRKPQPAAAPPAGISHCNTAETSFPAPPLPWDTPCGKTPSHFRRRPKRFPCGSPSYAHLPVPLCAAWQRF